MLVYCLRTGLGEVARASLITGFIGGIGFAGASMLKLVEVTSGYTTNWHSVLEQTTGFFNGIGIAVALNGLARRVGPLDSRVSPAAVCGRNAEMLAVGFVLLAIPYLNLRKNVADWTRAGAIPQVMYGIPAWAWFDLAALAVAACLTILMMRHRPAPGRGSGRRAREGPGALSAAPGHHGHRQLRARAYVGFKDQRLVTEGVIHLNALICATILLTAAGPTRTPGRRGTEPPSPPRWGRLVAIGVGTALVAVVADWAIVRGTYGDRFAGHAGLHIRFGPNATTSGPRR